MKFHCSFSYPTRATRKFYDNADVTVVRYTFHAIAMAGALANDYICISTEKTFSVDLLRISFENFN